MHCIPTLPLQAIERAAVVMAAFEHQLIALNAQSAGAITGHRTPAEARAWLEYQGISIAQWARENKKNDSLVREVLAGRKKCLRGESHNIAVLLGMKEGQITTRPGRVAPAMQGAVA
ncbi:DNA-binding protein [Comamonas aquatica]|uniref:DNA-binding protein n=1 Tax=Comamonas aquatica TaxID=225991 RepID=UPI00244CD4CF|nr:DNA-binding protein [Comamonas aquatica]MDH1766275.1 DNA-binding protein [Comamonas aquatica]